MSKQVAFDLVATKERLKDNPSDDDANYNALWDALHEIERLNKWADGFSDAQLKERQTAEAYQRELREYIGKLQKLLHERGCCQWAIDRFIGDAP